MTDQPQLASDLAHRVHAALAAVGVEHDIDWGPETLTVGDVVGVITQRRPGVTFYAVAEDLVPDDARDRVALAATWMNSRLAASTVELDVDRGLLSVRAAVSLGAPGGAILELLPEDLGALLATAVDEVRTTWSQVAEPLKAVIDGREEPDAAARVLDA